MLNFSCSFSKRQVTSFLRWIKYTTPFYINELYRSVSDISSHKKQQQTIHQNRLAEGQAQIHTTSPSPWETKLSRRIERDSWETAHREVSINHPTINYPFTAPSHVHVPSETNVSKRWKMSKTAHAHTNTHTRTNQKEKIQHFLHSLSGQSGTLMIERDRAAGQGTNAQISTQTQPEGLSQLSKSRSSIMKGQGRTATWENVGFSTHDSSFYFLIFLFWCDMWLQCCFRFPLCFRADLSLLDY